MWVGKAVFARIVALSNIDVPDMVRTKIPSRSSEADVMFEVMLFLHYNLRA